MHSRGLIGFSVCLGFSFMRDKLWILSLYDVFFFQYLHIDILLIISLAQSCDR